MADVRPGWAGTPLQRQWLGCSLGSGEGFVQACRTRHVGGRRVPSQQAHRAPAVSFSQAGGEFDAIGDDLCMGSGGFSDEPDGEDGDG
jgi:hypothetical protein